MRKATDMRAAKRYNETAEDRYDGSKAKQLAEVFRSNKSRRKKRQTGE